MRIALAEMLRSRRGIPVDAPGVVVTSGSQMALELLARALLQPGDTVAVEALGYQPAWQGFRQHGATLAPLPLSTLRVLEPAAGSWQPAGRMTTTEDRRPQTEHLQNTLRRWGLNTLGDFVALPPDDVAARLAVVPPP